MAKIKILHNSPLISLAKFVINPSSEEDIKIASILKEQVKLEIRLKRHKAKCALALKAAGYDAATISHDNRKKFNPQTKLYDQAWLYDYCSFAEMLIQNSPDPEHTKLAIDVGRRIGKMENRIPLRGKKENQAIAGLTHIGSHKKRINTLQAENPNRLQDISETALEITKENPTWSRNLIARALSSSSKKSLNYKQKKIVQNFKSFDLSPQAITTIISQHIPPRRYTRKK